jgi:phosphohistidine phosphatase
MTRELLLLRHGKSDWSTGEPDFDRPLKKRGENAAMRIGNWLLEQQLIPDLVMSSTARRARITAELACGAMGLDAKAIRWEPRVYEAGAAELLELLRQCPNEARRVLVVGHNPGLESLIQILSGPEAGGTRARHLPTAALAILSVAGDWNELGPEDVSLQSLINPRELPDVFPFPAPSGKELRKRPAYFYRQCAAIPYRRTDGKLEILLVTSRKARRWILPKGIVEPGLSPRESAAKEALEEAGVDGTIAEHPLGTYRYKKWGAICEVEVFPLEVQCVLPDEDWDESDRERVWLRPKQALKRLDRSRIKRLVAALVTRLQRK